VSNLIHVFVKMVQLEHSVRQSFANKLVRMEVNVKMESVPVNMGGPERRAIQPCAIKTVAMVDTVNHQINASVNLAGLERHVRHLFVRLVIAKTTEPVLLQTNVPVCLALPVKIVQVHSVNLAVENMVPVLVLTCVHAILTTLELNVNIA